MKPNTLSYPCTSKTGISKNTQTRNNPHIQHNIDDRQKTENEIKFSPIFG